MRDFELFMSSLAAEVSVFIDQFLIDKDFVKPGNLEMRNAAEYHSKRHESKSAI